MKHMLKSIQRYRPFPRQWMEMQECNICYVSQRNFNDIDSRFSPIFFRNKQTFSTETNQSSASDKYEFHYPKVKDLFERITNTMTVNDVEKLADEVNKILGRPVRQNEFYYNGFGGGSSGGNKSGSGGIQLESNEQQSEEAANAKPTVVDLKLTSYDAAAKIKVIKEIRSIAGLGLKEAKDLVESAPKIIQKGLKPEDAEILKKKLEDVGAVIELV